MSSHLETVEGRDETVVLRQDTKEATVNKTEGRLRMKECHWLDAVLASLSS